MRPVIAVGKCTAVCTQAAALSDSAIEKEQMTLLTSVDTAKQIIERVIHKNGHYTLFTKGNELLAVNTWAWDGTCCTDSSLERAVAVTVLGAWAGLRQDRGQGPRQDQGSDSWVLLGWQCLLFQQIQPQGGNLD